MSQDISVLNLSRQLDSISQNHQHRSGFMMDSWNGFNGDLYDSLHFQMEQAMDSLSLDSLFQLDKLLDSTYINVSAGSDNRLKVFQWEYINGGTMEDYFGYILYKMESGVIASLTYTYWVDNIFQLDSLEGSYLLIGHRQDCSSCFQEFAMQIYPRDSVFEIIEEESWAYRHSYVPAEVIRYIPETKTLIFNYDDVSFEGLYRDKKKAINYETIIE